MHNVEIEYIAYVCRALGNYTKYCNKANYEMCGQNIRECKLRKRQFNCKAKKCKEYTIEEDRAVILDTQFIPIEDIIFLKIDNHIWINKRNTEE